MDEWWIFFIMGKEDRINIAGRKKAIPVIAGIALCRFGNP